MQQIDIQEVDFPDFKNVIGTRNSGDGKIQKLLCFTLQLTIPPKTLKISLSLLNRRERIAELVRGWIERQSLHIGKKTVINIKQATNYFKRFISNKGTLPENQSYYSFTSIQKSLVCPCSERICTQRKIMLCTSI